MKTQRQETKTKQINDYLDCIAVSLNSTNTVSSKSFTK